MREKEKERKSIYIAPFCTKVHTKRSGMDHTVLPANNTMPAFPAGGGMYIQHNGEALVVHCTVRSIDRRGTKTRQYIGYAVLRDIGRDFGVWILIIIIIISIMWANAQRDGRRRVEYRWRCLFNDANFD